MSDDYLVETPQKRGRGRPKGPAREKTPDEIRAEAQAKRERGQRRKQKARSDEKEAERLEKMAAALEAKDRRDRHTSRLIHLGLIMQKLISDLSPKKYEQVMPIYIAWAEGKYFEGWPKIGDIPYFLDALKNWNSLDAPYADGLEKPKSKIWGHAVPDAENPDGKSVTPKS